MIYPQSNSFRQRKDLSGLWDFRIDGKNEGFRKGWTKGFQKARKIAVPSSWNESLPDLRDYLGPSWYQTQFKSFQTSGQKTFLRFNSVNYLCDVWLNGKKLGSHEGGHLPFVFEVTKKLKFRNNLLVVRVEGLLAPDRVPPGNVPYHPKDSFNNSFNPPASFDFFPYCGIQRPVLLFTTPSESIEDLTVTSDFKGPMGKVLVKTLVKNSSPASLKVSLEGFGWKTSVESALSSHLSTDLLKVPNPKLWAPGSPHLYQLKVELKRAGKTIDQVRLPVGIRTIKVAGNKLLFNGKSLSLRGFGRHEDYPGLGRHLPAKALKKDYANMRWIGANSFRTSHYPYSDEDMEMADRLGFLVIDETPAVGLFFKKKGLAKRLKLCRQYTREMIERDKNHPSVILWSLANEPHSHREEAEGFFTNLADLARSLDKTRPVTLVSYLGEKEKSFRFLDLVCVNRYDGWYSEPGDLNRAIPKLSKGLDRLYRKFKKPVLVTEFGADAVPGSHADPPEMFSEEYQTEMIARYLEILRRKPYIAGAHVWNLNDFKTAQATHRPQGMNFKGVFTRNRKPKMAAFLLKKIWNP